MYRRDRDQTDPPPTRSPSYAIAWLAEHAVPVAFGAYLACVFVLVCGLGSGAAASGTVLHVFVAIIQRLDIAADTSAGREPSKARAAMLAISWLALVAVAVIVSARFAWLTSP